MSFESTVQLQSWLIIVPNLLASRAKDRVATVPAHNTEECQNPRPSSYSISDNSALEQLTEPTKYILRPRDTN